MTHCQLIPSRFLPLLLTAAIIGITGLSACGMSDAKKAATQVAVKVNADEITVHQLNDALSKTPNITAEKAEEVKREILGKLIDRQLAVQGATEKKLDRTPNVMTAIESARSEILARAYLEQLVSAQPKPTEKEAKNYFIAHPELFAQRRLYNLQEIVITSARPELLPAVKDQVAKGHSMTEIAAWLKASEVKFSSNGGVRAAEQIPLEILPKIHALKDGQTIVLDDALAINITLLVASQAQPVNEATALPRIQQFLANKQGKEVALKELVALREKARIEFMGEFAMNTPPVVVKTAAPEKAKSDLGDVEKGMRGLK
jgi:EpsD family peptidyl-prolyl cis-trans isomerase